MACLSGLERDGYSLEIAKLADEHDVRILAQRCTQSALERCRVHSHLTLRNDAALVDVHEFDRVFDGDDVIITRAIHQVDKSAKRS